MDSFEHYQLSRDLEKYHVIFDRLWSMGIPTFTEDIPTAAVFFDKIGENTNFKINPIFWKTLTDKEKQFVISHECLHVILYHGIRINGLKKEDLSIANQALDIVVNHALVDKFGFSRKEIDSKNQYCWVDTVFPKNTPEKGEYFEYYFNLLKKQSQPNKQEENSERDGGGNQLVDSHEGLESFLNKEFEDKLKEISSPQELESISNFIESQTKDIQDKCKEKGCNPGNIFYNANIAKVKQKQKWETVIKRWAKKYIIDHSNEQWAVRNRRLSFMPNDFFIPSEQEIEADDKSKIQVWFFQDTSGSCDRFKDRFFSAAKSLPTNRFDVKMHCFDTKVFETSLQTGKLYGFGGTSFSCIENYIQSYVKKHQIAYPKAVFIITDGYGNYVNPQKPKNWYWFIDGSFNYVPKESQKFNLKDFE